MAVGPLRPPVATPIRAIPWERYAAALLRYKWLSLAILLIGTGIGLAATRVVQPKYEVQATIWISSESPQAKASGPFRAQELLNSSSWPDLLHSFAVLDEVAKQERLYLDYNFRTDSAAFSGFEIADDFRAGSYELKVASADAYLLTTTEGVVVEKGVPGDSIGRRLGFLWAPPKAVLRPGKVIRFRLRTPRAASVSLQQEVMTALPANSNLMRVRLPGTDPQLITRTLRALVTQFVQIATELKRRNLVEFSQTLGEQLAYAEQELHNAENALETFRVQTITLPSEGGPVPVGLEMTRDPVMKSFFEQKIEHDNLDHDRQALERILNRLRVDSGDVTAVWAVPAVQSYAPELRAALNEYATKQAALRAALEVYTPAHPAVQELQKTVTRLRHETLPTMISSLATELAGREAELGGRIDVASRDLRSIPTRTIEEMRLRRNVQVRENLYTALKARFEEAKLADASATPDVSVLDEPVAPQRPTHNTAPAIIAFAVTASTLIALLLTLFLDRIDNRVRYPEQITNELGLALLGAIPRIRENLDSKTSFDQSLQLLDAFRSIRLSVLYAAPNSHPLALTVSSPEAGDGKSLISSNLALSYAEAGYRTLLVDGDIRRGRLHNTFGVTSTPGLSDFLAGHVPLSAVIQETSQARLQVLPCGKRRRDGSELLNSPSLRRMFDTLASDFDVIIVDSAPLGAAVDPYILAATTGNLLLVLRSGVTDRRLCETRLVLADRLPIRVVGAVANAIPSRSEYQFYSYGQGYEILPDEKAIPATATMVARSALN